MERVSMRTHLEVLSYFDLIMQSDDESEREEREWPRVSKEVTDAVPHSAAQCSDVSPCISLAHSHWLLEAYVRTGPACK